MVAKLSPRCDLVDAVEKVALPTDSLIGYSLKKSYWHETCHILKAIVYFHSVLLNEIPLMLEKTLFSNAKDSLKLRRAL